MELLIFTNLSTCLVELLIITCKVTNHHLGDSQTIIHRDNQTIIHRDRFSNESFKCSKYFLVK